MTFPNGLTDFLQEPIDKYSFTISADITNTDTTIPISGGVGFNTPCIINLEDELIHATGTSGGSLTGCTRGYSNSTASSHTSGTVGYLPLTADHYNEMITGITNVKKYLGRTLSSAPSSPSAYEIYLNTSDGLVYMYTGSSWLVIGFMTGTQTHDDLRNLDSGDPHPVYYLENELVSAHNGIAGGHVTGGDNHDHLDGNGIGRIDTLDLTPTRMDTAPSYEGEVVLDTDTGTLWKAYDPGTGLEWQKVIGAPANAIAPFDPANLSSSCPTGWSRYTVADGRFIKGVTGGTAQSTGGSETHSHTYDATNIINHSHGVDQQTPSMSAPGTHAHSFKAGSGGSSKGVWNSDGSGSFDTSTNGGHSHTASILTNTNSTGVDPVSTDSANGEPPYELVIWCQKN